MKQEMMGSSDISWTIRGSSASCSRQITTPAPHTQFLQVGCSSWHPADIVKALKTLKALKALICLQHGCHSRQPDVTLAFMLYSVILWFINAFMLQCFDTDGWSSGRASGL